MVSDKVKNNIMLVLAIVFGLLLAVNLLFTNILGDNINQTLIVVTTYFGMYYSVNELEVFREKIRVRGIEEKDNFNNNNVLQKNFKEHKTKQSSNNKPTELSNKITSTIENEKLYLIPSLDLIYLSKKFSLSTTYISKKIAQGQETSFNDYINGLRLKEAESMLKSKAYENYTITSIAYECGFNSKSAFYRAFKKQYNMTPVVYREK